MKKTLCLCLIILILFTCACGKNEATTKMIDFTDYTVYEVISWANENDVASKFNYVFSSNTDKPSGSIIAQSVESGQPITDDIVITVASNQLLLVGGTAQKVVPNIIGKNIEEVKKELNESSIQFDTVYSTSTREKDTVILSDPLPGTGISDTTKIVLTLSSGKRESTVSITLAIKSDTTDDNVIKVYVDGELDRSKTVCLDPSITQKTFSFQGTGVKEVKFKINNEIVVVYNIDFSANKVYLID